MNLFNLGFTVKNEFVKTKLGFNFQTLKIEQQAELLQRIYYKDEFWVKFTWKIVDGVFIYAFSNFSVINTISSLSLMFRPHFLPMSELEFAKSNLSLAMRKLILRGDLKLSEKEIEEVKDALAKNLIDSALKPLPTEFQKQPINENDYLYDLKFWIGKTELTNLNCSYEQACSYIKDPLYQEWDKKCTPKPKPIKKQTQAQQNTGTTAMSYDIKKALETANQFSVRSVSPLTLDNAYRIIEQLKAPSNATAMQIHHYAYFLKAIDSKQVLSYATDDGTQGLATDGDNLLLFLREIGFEQFDRVTYSNQFFAGYGILSHLLRFLMQACETVLKDLSQKFIIGGGYHSVALAVIDVDDWAYSENGFGAVVVREYTDKDTISIDSFPLSLPRLIGITRALQLSKALDGAGQIVRFFDDKDCPLPRMFISE